MSKKDASTLLKATEKSLLGGHLHLLQPKKGYRSAIEPVILAASCNAKADEKILDLGCGVGTASLCLASRLHKKKLTIVGVDCQKDLIDLGKKNIELNNMADTLSFLYGDISHLSHKQLPRGCFHHVITNPPFYKQKDADPSPYKSKHIGHIETTVQLKEWLYYCKKFLRSQGVLTIIYCAERMSELLEGLVFHNFGAIEVIPLWPRSGVCAKRVVLRAKKCRRLSTKIHPGIVLHNENGYTDEAQHILTEGKSLSSILGD